METKTHYGLTITKEEKHEYYKSQFHMSKILKHFSIDDYICEALEEESDKTNKSQAKLVREALIKKLGIDKNE